MPHLQQFNSARKQPRSPAAYYQLGALAMGRACLFSSIAVSSVRRVQRVLTIRTGPRPQGSSAEVSTHPGKEAPLLSQAGRLCNNVTTWDGDSDAPKGAWRPRRPQLWPRPPLPFLLIFKLYQSHTRKPLDKPHFSLSSLFCENPGRFPFFFFLPSFFFFSFSCLHFPITTLELKKDC